MILITLFFISSGLLCWFLILITLDCFICFRALSEILYEFYLTQIAPRIGKSINLKRYGEWAVVTGATDGLGKGYVLAFASKGLNVVLVSRSEEKLKKVVAEVKEKYPKIDLRFIVHDFSSCDKKDENKFAAAFQQLYPKIGILVNNVGTTGDDFAKDFVELQNRLEVSNNLVNVNVSSMLSMTSFLLPEFVRRRNGVIVNICSISAVHPGAGMALYNGSKAFMDFFSRTIRQENMKWNVKVQTVYPGFVKTNMVPDSIKSQLPTFIAPDYESYSKQCVETLGALPETYGCFSHRLQAYLLSLVKCLPVIVGDNLILKLSEMRMATLQGKFKKVQ